jgi:hypothetical protein
MKKDKTDMLDLQPPRHTPTLPIRDSAAAQIAVIA